MGHQLVLLFFSTEDGMNDSLGFMSPALPTLLFALPRLLIFAGRSAEVLSDFAGGDEMETDN